MTMLDGITVLHTFEQTTGTALVWVAWIGVILLAAAAFYCWVLTTNKRTMGSLALALTATFICFCCFAFAINTEPRSETLYKVTIDKSVSYREFTYYYEVINVEGEIYTVREIVHDDYPTVPPAPTEESTIPSTWNPDAVG